MNVAAVVKVKATREIMCQFKSKAELMYVCVHVCVW